MERRFNQELLKFPCRRHVLELHAISTLRLSQRETTGPGDALFKNLYKKWLEIKDSLNANNVSKYDWNENLGSYLNERASEVYGLLNDLLDGRVFPRSDYLELCELAFF